MKTAEITLERLNELDAGKYPCNALIDYVAKRHSFAEQARQFLQQMRDYRNRISYEGFMVSKNYLSLNEKMIKDIINRLFSELSGNKN